MLSVLLFIPFLEIPNTGWIYFSFYGTNYSEHKISVLSSHSSEQILC